MDKKSKYIWIGKKVLIIAGVNGNRPLKKNVTEGEEEHAGFYKNIAPGEKNPEYPECSKNAEKCIKDDVKADVCSKRIKCFNHGL
jgi:hypothetical protein